MKTKLKDVALIAFHFLKHLLPSAFGAMTLIIVYVLNILTACSILGQECPLMPNDPNTFQDERMKIDIYIIRGSQECCVGNEAT